MGRVAREIISFGPTQPDANGRSMKSLDRCVQQELGKSGRNEDSSPRASAGVGKLTEDLGKRGRGERRGVRSSSARNADVECQAALSVKCILATTTGESRLTRRGGSVPCPSPSPFLSFLIAPPAPTPPSRSFFILLRRAI